MSLEAALTRPTPWRGLAFFAGLAVLIALWCGPLPALSHTAFSAHMLLHLGVVVVAAPLLAALPGQWLAAATSFSAALGWTLLAAAFEMVAVWGWHVPVLHDLAGHTPGFFIAEQMSFLAGGLALWTVVLGARKAAQAGAAAIATFITFTHMTMFGLLLGLAPTLIYDPDLCQGAFGLDRLDDQHLGGALMAVGGFAYLGATITLCARALRRG